MAKAKSTNTGIEIKYKTFLDNVELYALGLDKLTASLERAEYFETLADKPEDVIREIKSNLFVSEFDEDHFDVTGVFSLALKLADGTPPLFIECVFSAHFHPRKGTFRRKDAEQFAQTEARLVFWPYFRQTVADITARMHVRPITIPLVFRP
jgi:preprotein translocase subunit SecB